MINGQLLQLTITSIRNETQDTKTFFLSPAGINSLKYQAGQFITIIMQHGDVETRRSYSLGSTPGVDVELFITVKRQPNGHISRHLFDHYHPGDTLTVLKPSGRFIIHSPVSKDYIFIAAGSGITPVFALIKALLHFHPSTYITLINQCSNEDNIIYRQQLQQLQQQFAQRFTIIQLFSQPKDYRYLSQRLNNALLETLLQQIIFQETFFQANFYLCGPLSFMRMAQFTLKLMGVAETQIRKEQFIIDTPPPPPLVKDSSPKQITIHYNGQVYHIKAAYPKSILTAALEQGLHLPYSCRGGRCSTCMAICTKGKITMSINEVLTGQELANGWILTCTGYALTDVELSYETAV